jgi:hypothetical protein
MVDIIEWSILPLHSGTEIYALAAFFTLPMHAPRKSNSKNGLKPDIAMIITTGDHWA